MIHNISELINFNKNQFWLRFLLMLILPLAIIIGAIYVIVAKPNLIINQPIIISAICLGIVIILYLTRHYVFTAFLFGHVILPYYSYLMSGTAVWMNYVHKRKIVYTKYELYTYDKDQDIWHSVTYDAEKLLDGRLEKVN